MLMHAHDAQDGLRPRIVYQEFNNVVLMGSVAVQTFLYGAETLLFCYNRLSYVRFEGFFFMLVILAVYLLS